MVQTVGKYYFVVTAVVALDYLVGGMQSQEPSLELAAVVRRWCLQQIALPGQAYRVHLENGVMESVEEREAELLYFVEIGRVFFECLSLDVREFVGME